MRILVLLSFIGLLSSCGQVGQDNELSGSTWEIYQYKEVSSTAPLPLADTLFFETHNAYRYNNIPDKYTLTQSANQKVLSLYGSKFGDISGTISADFAKYGEIVGVSFSTMGTGENQSEYILWLRQID